MKTITITSYKFNELSDEAQEKAIENNYDINVDYGWWESVYEDAKNIGLKITSSDEYTAKGEFIDYAIDTAKAIVDKHGKDCDTYQTAKDFLAIPVPDDDADDELHDAYGEEEEKFLSSLLEDYRIMLWKEYDYLISEEAIKETLVVNDYDFTADGEMY